MFHTFPMSETVIVDKAKKPEKKKYPCDKCEFSGDSKSGLTRHHKSQHGMENQLKCKFENCDKRYAYVGSLNRHMKDCKKGK